MRGTIRPARCKENLHRDLRDVTKWEITIDRDKLGGKRHQHTERFDGTRAECETRLAQLQYELGTNRYIAPMRKPLGQHLDEWLSHAPALDISQSSAVAYRRIVELYIKPALGHVQLQRLTLGDVMAFKVSLVTKVGVRGQMLAPATIAKVLAVLSSSMDYAYQCGYVHENICKRMKVGKSLKVHPRKIRVLNEEETVRLIASARGSELYLPILIAATTGMRRGEILALTWGDIDFEQNVIHVTHALAEVEGNVIVKDPKSYAGVRDVSMPHMLAEELRLHSGEGRLCGEVKPSTFSKQFSRWMKRCGGKRITFHGLRHTHGSLLIKRGATSVEVRDRLGHASITTTNTYSHVVDDDVARVVDEMLGVK